MDTVMELLVLLRFEGEIVFVWAREVSYVVQSDLANSTSNVFVVQKMVLLLVARQNRRNSNADISKDLAFKF